MDYKKYSLDYEDFGNYNYTIVGRAIGFSEEIVQTMTGLVSLKNNGIKVSSFDELIKLASNWFDAADGMAIIRQALEVANKSVIVDSRTPICILSAGLNGIAGLDSPLLDKINQDHTNLTDKFIDTFKNLFKNATSTASPLVLDLDIARLMVGSCFHQNGIPFSSQSGCQIKSRLFQIFLLG